MQKLREFLEKIVHDKSETYDDFQFGCHTGRVGLAEEILSEYLPEDSKFCQCELCKKTSCSQCTHWNDGYGNDDICECLGCPQNCDNYTVRR